MTPTRWALAAVLLPALTLSGCVTKGTHNTTLAELASVQDQRASLEAEVERRRRVEADLRADMEEASSEADGRERALLNQIERLQGEVELYTEESERLEMLRRQARAEVDRLETALRQRGGEYRELQQRLESLAAIEREIRDRNRIYQDVIGRFQSLIDGGQLSVAIVRGRLVIQLPQDVLFESGSAVIGRDGRQTLAEVGAVLATLEDRSFQVEGHTDNVPIATARFPSNWELSSARALAVVQLLAQQGVAPQNLSGAGYGEFQPVAPNDSAENRRRNRRIEIVMLPNLDVIAATQLPG